MRVKHGTPWRGRGFSPSYNLKTWMGFSRVESSNLNPLIARIGRSAAKASPLTPPTDGLKAVPFRQVISETSVIYT